jgi:hypothetical protein
MKPSLRIGDEVTNGFDKGYIESFFTNPYGLTFVHLEKKELRCAPEMLTSAFKRIVKPAGYVDKKRAKRIGVTTKMSF